MYRLPAFSFRVLCIPRVEEGKKGALVPQGRRWKDRNAEPGPGAAVSCGAGLVPHPLLRLGLIRRSRRQDEIMHKAAISVTTFMSSQPFKAWCLQQQPPPAPQKNKNKNPWL